MVPGRGTMGEKGDEKAQDVMLSVQVQSNHRWELRRMRNSSPLFFVASAAGENQVLQTPHPKNS